MTKKITSFNSAAAVAVAMPISASSIANLGWLWNSEEVDRSFAISTPNYRYLVMTVNKRRQR